MEQAEYTACEPGENGDARLEIVITEGSNVLTDADDEVKLTAKVYKGANTNPENINSSYFNWTRDSGNPNDDAVWNSGHQGTDYVEVPRSSLTGTTKFYCTMSPVADYGEFFPAIVNGRLELMHDTHTASSDVIFKIGHQYVNGVEDTTSPEIYLNATVDSGEPYSFSNPVLSVDSNNIAGPMTAGMYVYTAAPTREIRFYYNADGLRTRKETTLGGRVVETTDYILHGKLVTEMRRGSDVLHFFYDAQSRPAMVKWNGQMYTYVHNLQGDIVAILDSSGAKVVEYKYDAWGRDIGRTLTSDIGELNPFRYRGYVYDEETGLYYLRSRYYSAGLGRFINNDFILGPSFIGGFTYASNNPIAFMDSDGTLPETTCVNTHLYDDEHYAIEIFGVLFHSTEGGYYVEPRYEKADDGTDKDNGANIVLYLTGVPRDRAIAGVRKALKWSNNKVPDDFDKADSLIGYMESFYYHKVSGSNGHIYNRQENPCAAFVEAVFNAVFKGTPHTFASVWGSPKSVEQKDKKVSNYLISSRFREVYKISDHQFKSYLNLN